MEISTLGKSLIRAARSQCFDELFKLLDEYEPDLNQDDFVFKANDDMTVTGSVAHVIGCYVSHYGEGTELKRVLDLGCCSNSNMRQSTELSMLTRTRSSMPFVAIDKYYADSRPLINAITQGKLDMVSLLINHPCPCCAGQGAKITPTILSLAEECASAHKEGVAICDLLTKKSL